MLRYAQVLDVHGARLSLSRNCRTTVLVASGLNLAVMARGYQLFFCPVFNVLALRQSSGKRTVSTIQGNFMIQLCCVQHQ